MTVSARLLILDFDGVCTYNHREIVSNEIGVSDIQNLIRPGVSELINMAQARGVVVAVLSNDLPPSWVDELELLQRVDHVVICSDNGILKPDRRAFQRCLLLSGIEAENTVLVDDHADNVTVAGSLGMEAFHFDAGFAWTPVMEALGV
jgi:HAD superfamily hydrolase (TIGR01509 family)